MLFSLFVQLLAVARCPYHTCHTIPVNYQSYPRSILIIRHSDSVLWRNEKCTRGYLDWCVFVWLCELCELYAITSRPFRSDDSELVRKPLFLFQKRTATVSRWVFTIILLFFLHRIRFSGLRLRCQ